MSSCLSDMMTMWSIKKKTKQNCKDLKRRVRGFPGHPIFSYFPFFLCSLDANFLEEKSLDLFKFTQGSTQLFRIK